MRIRSFGPIIAMLLSAFVIGVLIEFSRSEQMRMAGLTELWIKAITCYVVPAAILARAIRTSKMVWLIPPILGTIFLQLLAVTIPNALTLWKLPGTLSLSQKLRDVLPGQVNHFTFFIVFYSVVAYVIAALTYVGWFGIRMARNRSSQAVSRS